MKLVSCSENGANLIRECQSVVDFVFPVPSKRLESQLHIVVPEISGISSGSIPDALLQVHVAWHSIVNCRDGKCLSSWRGLDSISDVVVPGVPIFRRLKSGNRDYLILIKRTDADGLCQFNDILFFIRIWNHLRLQRVVFHGAAVRVQNTAFVFLGPSGAGKSTVAKYGEDSGYHIIHDDHIVVEKNEQGECFVMGLSDLAPPSRLDSVYILEQSETDCLVRMDPVEVAKSLIASFNDTYGDNALKQFYMGSVFRNVCEIARNIPGFTLCFRKSPGFWNMILQERKSGRLKAGVKGMLRMNALNGEIK